MLPSFNIPQEAQGGSRMLPSLTDVVPSPNEKTNSNMSLAFTIVVFVVMGFPPLPSNPRSSCMVLYEDIIRLRIP
jgi:hypothetical protein